MLVREGFPSTCSIVNRLREKRPKRWSAAIDVSGRRRWRSERGLKKAHARQMSRGTLLQLRGTLLQLRMKDELAHTRGRCKPHVMPREREAGVDDGEVVGGKGTCLFRALEEHDSKDGIQLTGNERSFFFELVD